ncbi:MAG: DNA repair protein RadA [Saprospiraceae bacterium]|nr:DNA repair protein RadA [Saprospiraceae bacterium]
MAKSKTVFVCSTCGTNSPKWIGHCPGCSEWNTYVEETYQSPGANEEPAWKKLSESSAKPKPVRLDQIQEGVVQRIDCKDSELNRALGGGMVKGSVTLLAGQPGIGKSTLLLQLALNINLQNTLYVSGEESEDQIKIRAQRLNLRQDRCYLFSEVKVESILHEAAKMKAELIIVDSIQTLISETSNSVAGSISQIRDCTHEIIRYAKETSTPVFIIGHITKEGDIAGPKLLEHMVDTVLHFEGDKHYSYRILRTIKNRFGSTDEMSLYQMNINGLMPVTNPSELLLSQHDERLSGSAIACTLEGLRPLLVETQALVGSTVYSTPQRVATGFDNRKLSMLLAVLEKRCGFHFGIQDVFLNIAGGIKINDPAIDLAVVASLISSLENQALHRQICFAGEVGLSGEIRAVNRIDLRIQEAERQGFRAICISKFNGKVSQNKNSKIKIVQLSTVIELYEKVFTNK